VDVNQWATDNYAENAEFCNVRRLGLFLAMLVPSTSLFVDACFANQSVGYNGTVTPAYEAAAQSMTRHQIALGGYRLAALLDTLLQNGIPGRPRRLQGSHS
jgi:hypothetical protein